MLAFAFLSSVSLSAPAQTLPCVETNGVKFLLPPQTQPYQGFDVKDSRNGIVLADDFQCTNSGPITDIHVWGSWLNDLHNANSITNFWIGIYSDVPAVTNYLNGQVTNSHPGTLLWWTNFPQGQFSENIYTNAYEYFYNPTNNQIMGNDTVVYYYCFFPPNPFQQQGSVTSPTNYWLAIRAQLQPGDGTLYGWKSSAIPYHDPAVWGTVDATGFPSGNWQSMTNPNTQQPLDLSMMLTTPTNPPCHESNGVKYVQEPNLNGGLDLWNSSSKPAQVTDGPWWLADDFVCTNTGPITDIHLWGSWLNDQALPGSITFQLYVFNDVPATIAPYSHPGTNVIWHQTFTPGSYAETIWTNYAQENFVDPGSKATLSPDSVVWYYCFYPTNLMQYGTATQPTNYWLAVFAELPTGIPNTNFFGWKTTTIVQNDISVHSQWLGFGVPPPNAWTPNYQSTGQPLDLAFKLTTPTNCVIPITCPSLLNKTVQCGTTWTFDQPIVGQPPCCPNPTVLFSTVTNNIGPCSETIIGTWVILDCSFNLAGTCTQTVTVVDTNPPVITSCPSNMIVYTCSNIVVTWTITATDTCSSTTVTSTPPSGTVFWMNTINPVLVTASDACGNQTNGSFTITVLPGAGCMQCVETNRVKFMLPPDTQSQGALDVKDSRDNIVLADDFYCNTTGFITDIHLWGSWNNDQHGTITNFWIGIYNDVPAMTNFANGKITPSHPGTNLLWQQSFGLGQYGEIIYTNGYEHFYNPTSNLIIGSDLNAWYYCFNPTNPFYQQGTPANPTNYWLAVRAQLAPDGTLFGWKSSTTNYNDAAVWGTVANGLPIGNWQSMTNPSTGQQIDLSFKLTTLPVLCVESDYEKYIQWPNTIGGYDVWNNPYVLADDFVCTNTGPISDIHLWGSWLYDQALTNSITFWLGIYDDVPTNANNPFSHPGTNLLWQQWFAPGKYAEMIWTANAQEFFLDPGPTNIMGQDFTVWYYCFYPTNAFQQLGTPTNSKTYWLAAYAQLPAGTQSSYGWKTTTNVLNDTSVHALWPGNPPTNNPGWKPTCLPSSGGPLDLAFKLTMCGPVKINWLAPTNVVLTWQGGGYLQSATNVLGPYIDVPGFPPSPYTDSSVPPPTNRFYRVRCY